MKVLVVASHPQNGTGYGRVTNKITNYLASIGIEVFIYAIRKFDLIEKYVDPSIKIFTTNEIVGYGFDYEYLNTLLSHIKPDSLFIYDDVPVILNFVNNIKTQLRPQNLYIYLDIVFPYMKDIYIKQLKAIKPTQIFTFLDCWKKHLIDDLKFDEDIVSTLPHGVDGNEFLIKESVAESKKYLGFNPDDFIVLNMNRNSHRKCLDITIESFLRFLIEEKLNPKIKLYLHCEINRIETFNLLDVISMECLNLGLDFDNILKNNIIFSNKTTLLAEDDVHRIYNACDVGMNTCCGEGFGLTTVEHSCFNKPQIVSAVPALKETMNGIGYYASIEHSHMFLFETSNMMGYAMYPKVLDFTKHLKYLYHNRDHYRNYRDIITSRYNWNKTYECLNNFFGKRDIKLQVSNNKSNMKIIFLSTHPKMGNGYARVSNMITNYLATIPNVEVVYYAFQSYHDSLVKDRYVDPRIKIYEANTLDPNSELGLGYFGLVPTIEKEKPDAIFIYYEPSVIINMMNMIPENLIPKYKYFYIDLFYKWENMVYFTDMLKYKPTQIFTFLDCWKDHVVNDLGIDKNLVTTLPHGVDFERFKIMSPEDAKVQLGFNKDDFLVINMNRNSFRKGTDATIRAFLEFLKMKDFDPRIKLYLGCVVKFDNIGYDLITVINAECFKRKINPKRIMEKHIIFSKKPHHASDHDINLIYNAGDVGMNTCNGEGFGLTVVEHAYFNKPQIVSSVPAIKDTSSEFGFFADPMMTITTHPSDVCMGELVLSRENDYVKHLEYIFDKGKDLSLNSQRSIVENRFAWKNAYKVLDRYFRK